MLDPIIKNMHGVCPECYYDSNKEIPMALFFLQRMHATLTPSGAIVADSNKQESVMEAVCVACHHTETVVWTPEGVRTPEYKLTKDAKEIDNIGGK